MSDCSEVRIWSNWTGVVARADATLSPSFSVGADGVPGCTSTKKLPSRKMRGRIANVASLWMGRPLSSICIFTSAPGSPGRRCWTPTTLPTFTPAIRTGEAGRRLLAVGKTALIVKWCWNGIAFVNPK